MSRYTLHFGRDQNIYRQTHSCLVYTSGISRKLLPDLVSRALRRLEYLDLAESLDDLKVPPSNRLHTLKGTGQYSISINNQWRICFVFVDGDAYDVRDNQLSLTR